MIRSFTLPLLLCLNSALAAQTPGKVLIIGIDGCRADALRSAIAPNIHALLDHSVYSWDALTRYPTWSGPGWSSMCTGVWQEKHGVLDNSFTGSNYDAYPHFIKRMELHNPALRSTSVVHWSPINTQINTLCDIEINVPTDIAVKDSAVAALQHTDPDVLFVAFDDVDHAGHSYGFDPSKPEYMASIQVTDGYVGQILAAMQARPDFDSENWLVILTTDHGGNLQGHGGASFEEQNIFFIAWKPELNPLELKKDSSMFLQANGLSFNGVDQLLLPESSAPFTFGDSQDFSIEMRIRYNNLSGDAAFISNKDWDSGLNTGWVISTPFSDQTRWKVNIADGLARRDITGGVVNDGQWHHLSVTFDRDGLMSLYQDGSPIGQTDMSALGNVDTNFPVVIGQDGTFDYPFYYAGDIAEVRIWKTVLAPETVAAYACGTLNINHPDAAHLVSYWVMDEGVGNTVTNALIGAPACEMLGDDAVWTDVPGNIICQDYSATPRIVDVAVTALTHLCVPIDPAWELDGRSHVDDCATIGSYEIAALNDKLEIAPNPASDLVRLRLLTEVVPEIILSGMYSVQGQLMQTFPLKNGTATLSLSDWPGGVYLLRIPLPDGSILTGRLVVRGR